MPPDEQSNVPSQPHSRWATRSSMIADMQQVSSERWNNFVLVYSRLIKSWILSKSVPPAAVDDILQETLKSVFTGIGKFECGTGKGTFRGWLRTITERRVADYFRSQTEDNNTAQDVLDGTASPEQKDPETVQAEQQALHELKARALELIRQTTSEKTWQMFWLSTVEEVPTAEIAREFDVSNAAVRVYKKRVLNRLRELMVDEIVETA